MRALQPRRLLLGNPLQKDRGPDRQEEYLKLHRRLHSIFRPWNDVHAGMKFGFVYVAMLIYMLIISISASNGA